MTIFRKRILLHARLALLLAIPWLPAASQPSPEVPETVVFGGDAAYPPFEWLDGGEAKGFNIDLERAIAELGGRRAEHVLGDWPDTIRALENGDIDVVPMFRSSERSKSFTFSATFQYVYHAVFAREGAGPIREPEELAGQSVVVEEFSYAHHKLLESGIDVELVLAANTYESLLHVAEGRTKYALLAVPATAELIHRHELPVRRTGVPLWPGEYAFAVRKDRTELAEWLRVNLAQAIAGGRYDDVRRKWEAQIDGRVDFEGALREVAVVIVPLLLLILLIAGWSWSLRRTVSARTHALREELERREQAEAHLQHLANHDAFTGLPMTDHFIRKVDEMLHREGGLNGTAGELAVMKLAERGKVARIFGYEIAEQLVREFAKRLGRVEHTACAYLGRGRFAVFSDNWPIRTCVESLTKPLDINRVELVPSVVAGVARCDANSRSASELLRHAETALGNSIMLRQQWTQYDSSMEPDEADLRIVSDFRSTLGNDLFAVFQPQVEIETGKLVGAEALVRWNHPQLGMIQPTQFIPLLESVGLISQVTRRMINEAVRVAVELRRKVTPCVISVNIAAYDLVDKQLPQFISSTLEKHGGRASDLKLELTETSVADDPARVRDSLEVLNEIGVLICIDDFGTGHSSLSYLSSFPIQELKIDREFVGNMVNSKRNSSIVRSTILMAHELGLLTVAEGAEDEQTIDMLKLAGCDCVQGYVIARPMPESDFTVFVANACRRSGTADGAS